jgi:DNA-binding MarR family transcriptional regulator
MKTKPLGDNAAEVRRLTRRNPDMTVGEIARRLGLTTQRIYQIRDALEARGELKRAR